MTYGTKDELLDGFADYILGDGEKPEISNASGFLFRKIYTPAEIETGLYYREKRDRILHDNVRSGGRLLG